jgi:hypothetical protein
MTNDPVETNPTHYSVLFENERVRVLEYHDVPGDRTLEHEHPDSVMVTLSSFGRRLTSGDRSMELELPAGAARWLPAQTHYGENIGGTETRAIFVELLEPSPGADAGKHLGPERI